MLLAFGPLFFAVASLARATVVGAREEAARAVGRAILAHVVDVGGPTGEASAISHALMEHAGRDADAICVFVRDGVPPICEGAPDGVAALRAAGSPRSEFVHMVHAHAGRIVEVATGAGNYAATTRIVLDSDVDRSAPLVRLVALYMAVFAFALLVFTYFALTRLIVRPVEQLVDAADRVGGGARTLRVPRTGARELVDLGASVQAMAEKLIAEEEALRRKVLELTAMTRELTQTQAQLVRSERMASVGRLAAGLAHEIGNPIAALIGMLDLLLDGELEADVERDFIRRMRSETERIHRVIRDLLDFARPEGILTAGGDGRASADDAPADVRAVVDDVIALVRPQKLLHQVNVDIDVEGPVRVALAAPRLTQVLLNLVLNAAASITATKRGHGHIVVRARSIDRERIRIAVEDDGTGIAPTVRDRLFEPFATTKEVGEGTGLGLAVCRGLVESAGGEIGVDASRAQGACFYVILPVAPETA